MNKGVKTGRDKRDGGKFTSAEIQDKETVFCNSLPANVHFMD